MIASEKPDFSSFFVDNFPATITQTLEHGATTCIILFAISLVIPLRMTDEQLLIGDDAVHGEEAYALWGDGEKYDIRKL